MSERIRVEKVTCQTKPIGLWGWLTCWLCWEVKAGITLLLASWALLLWGDLPLPRWRWITGWVCYWFGVSCLLYGLARDLIIMGKALVAWSRQRWH